jgi:hypothetical protein
MMIGLHKRPQAQNPESPHCTSRYSQDAQATAYLERCYSLCGYPLTEEKEEARSTLHNH